MQLLCRISKRRGKKHAIIAMTGKILVVSYHILKTGEVFDPSDIANGERTAHCLYHKQLKKYF